MSNWDEYGKDLIEPEALELPNHTDASVAFAFSAAVSLKRIADVIAPKDGSPSPLFTQPVNCFGESFTDAIQMAFIRGQRGDDRI